MNLEINRRRFNELCLTLMLYLVMLRATNIGVGYPNAEYRLAEITYVPQKLMQIALLLILAFFTFVTGWRLLAALRIPPLPLLVVGAVLMSLVLSPQPGLTIRYIFSVAVVTVPIYLYYRFFGASQLYQAVLKFIFWLTLANALYMVLMPQFGIMTANHEGAWRGMFVHKNAAGAFFALATVLFYGEMLAAKRLAQLGRYLLLMLIAVVMVVMSKSSTALVVLVVTVATFHFALFLANVQQRRNKVVLLVVYALLLVGVYLLTSVYMDDLLALVGKDPTLTGRTGLWEVLLDLSLQRPLQGYGLGLFSRPEVMYEFSGDFGWDAKSSHSSYVDLVLGIGYPGALLFLGLLLTRICGSLLLARSSGQERLRAAAVIGVGVGLLLEAGASSGSMLATSYSWVLLLAMLLCCGSTMSDSPGREQGNEHVNQGAY